MNQAFEIKAAITSDDAGEITGIAWPFGTADRVGDMIEKGAFSGAMLPVPMLFGHNPNDPVGVWESVEETDTGLQVKGRLLVADVARAREVHALVASGAVGGLSIGFSTKKAAPRRGGGRTISALDLVEISLVTVPAHPGARVTSKKAAANAIAIAEAINRAAAALKH
ncbi:HK97 family phage prohead protease [Jiella avicenniae]|uniref:HK97 family phage prohead protease n=1 Tax=Jiella avicenniae TaxID=2907202 RepID=A0A9X1P3D8_9HYPH|nr:HK97 family phage prohead protease [Jiella avicenniae]MCE7029536.1 HK97 family phage prohead protease [Jiella avicenniae]